MLLSTFPFQIYKKKDMEYVFLFPGRDLFTSFKKFDHQTKSSCIENNKALLKMFHTVKLQFLTERQPDVGNVNYL